jgi:nucleotide-binding universal stress UspA family protein
MPSTAERGRMLDMEARREPAVGRLLLAVDHTAASRRAVDEAIRLAASEHASMVVFSVVERENLRLPGGHTRRVDQERARLESGVRGIVDRAREHGVDATYLIWEGEPAEAIVEAAVTEGADLIVLGSRRRTDIRRLILGSVSSAVTKDASCRVLVVPS